MIGLFGNVGEMMRSGGWVAGRTVVGANPNTRPITHQTGAHDKEKNVGKNWWGGGEGWEDEVEKNEN